MIIGGAAFFALLPKPPPRALDAKYEMPMVKAAEDDEVDDGVIES